MRHRLGLRKLNRTSAHRLAMLRNMMCSLIKHEAIKTTLPKAKELRRVVEPMITLAKEPKKPDESKADFKERTKDIKHPIIEKMFREYAPKYNKRKAELGQGGGYTRILKMGFRVGDNAPMAYMELTEKAVAVEEVKSEE